MTKRIMRGVQDIKTLSGRVDKRSVPYKAYLKLALLEMEKYRRGTEKTNALEKVRHIDQRFKDIDDERQELLQALEAGGSQPQRLPGLNETPKAAPRTTTGPFKIRY